MDEEDELSPSELPEDLETFDAETETGITDRVPYNKQLTYRACSGRTGEYWPEVVAVRTSVRSVPPRPRADIPQYGPRARLVSGYYQYKSNSFF